MMYRRLLVRRLARLEGNFTVYCRLEGQSFYLPSSGAARSLRTSKVKEQRSDGKGVT